MLSISVLIPAHNCSKTIKATLDTVIGQTVPPDEVIVLDDGSTDHTFAILESYGPRITVLQQANKGVAEARNVLVTKAAGDLIAFVDTDDLWHPQYLEVQRRSFEEHPNAVAFFTGHSIFFGYSAFDWTSMSFESTYTEVFDPLEFFTRYNATGAFASMSFCCVPKEVVMRMGSEPFQVTGVDDAYFCNLLPLFGQPVAYVPLPLVAYRVTSTAQSSDQLKIYGALIEAFQLLRKYYDTQATASLFAAFQLAFASKRRTYAKLLMGSGRIDDARRQLRLSMRDSSSAVSRMKSLILLLLSHTPRPLQPSWPTTTRPVATHNSIPLDNLVG